MNKIKIAEFLSGGDRRSIGRSNTIAAYVQKNPKAFAELFRCMWSDDPIVRMRDADAAEKASGRNPELLQPYKSELLGLLRETSQQELRWHLAQMIPRLPLSAKELQDAATHLRGYLNDRSSIVKTFAIQALADLSQHDADLRVEVRLLVQEQVRIGTAAMRARCRQLLKHLEN